MATLVFTALGTAIGGPLGGAIGSLIGNQLDRAIIGSAKREGPRLKELAVTTSSYGSPIPRHFGTMRAAGTIIWATDLIESSESRGGGKGSPSTTTFSYSASFAVALASRPILGVERIWADGNLLRGAAGDLKTGGKLRIYAGHGDQQADPLIASDKGAACPAFRGLAYCVFEALQLADFGNRVPALTFEIVADDGVIALADVLGPLVTSVATARVLPGLVGFSDEGGPVAGTLGTLDQVYPLACDGSAAAPSIIDADLLPGVPLVLPAAARDEADEGFGARSGTTRKRRSAAGQIPQGLRYYEVSRDYQAGVQRAGGRARPGEPRTLEFPGALEAATAHGLINRAADRIGAGLETLSWRTAELDPRHAPGSIVRVPDQPGLWSIESWEWRENGVELELRRMTAALAPTLPADPGQALSKPDLLAGPTQLVAFELPWSGRGSGDLPQAFAAVSSVSPGWTGAALYLDQGGELLPIGASGPRRSIVGQLALPLQPSCAMLFEGDASCEVELIAGDFQLAGASLGQLAQGANRAVVGNEIIQFATATRASASRWRLGGLLRGRGGTESVAADGHGAGAAFVLLDDAPVGLDGAIFAQGGPHTIAAIGLADSEPVLAEMLNTGSTTRPLSPVHPRVQKAADGSVMLQWTRRARGAWTWLDAVEVPLNEETERYLIGVGDPDAPAVRWEASLPQLAVSAGAMADLQGAYPGSPIWVRQVGRFAASNALLLTTLD